MNNCTIQPSRAGDGLLLEQEIYTFAVCTGDFPYIYSRLLGKRK